MAEPDVVPVAPDMVVSETLGGYDLLRRLGSGGMAEVHLARANGIEGFQKLVVLKQILPHLSRDKHFVRMFLEEARLAAVLDHPNVVQVFDLGQQGDEYFFTMEFVYGENLQALLRSLQKVEQVLSIENVVSIGIGVAAGLHYAHERVGFDGRPLGIVHRDVSPTNVMITYEGAVKVADFGIAKVVTRTDVTRAGTRKGKVPYMSPEQCRAQKIDRRSDVFSLGIVLWEAVTGQRLFEGDNEFGVMNMIVHGQVRPPSTLRPDIPPPLERIIMKALSTDKAARFQSTRELQFELEQFACEHRIRATPSALGELMHFLFRPQPFPLGALRGNSGRGQMSPATLAEISSMVGSQPSIPGTGVMRSEVTSGVRSYASHATGSGLSTSASLATGFGSGIGSTEGTGFGRASSSGGAQPQSGRNKTIRTIALGMGAAAAMAAVLVLGLWLGRRGATAEASAQGAAAAASLSHAGPGDAAVAGDRPDQPSTPPAEAEAEPTVPAQAADEPEVDGKVEPEPELDADPEAEAELDADPEAEAEAEAEPELVIEDDSPGIRRGGPRKTEPKGKPATSPKAKKEKKPDLDAFMPGMGG